LLPCKPNKGSDQATALRAEKYGACRAADKTLLLTIKLELARIPPGAGDKTFTSDSVTRCSEHHIQRSVKHFDDDCSKRVLKPSSLKKNPQTRQLAPMTVKTFKGEMMKRQYARIVTGLVGFPQIARAGTQYSFLVSG
jgi:hypothetical protein